MSIRISLSSSRPTVWMHREDREVNGYLRSCAPCPAVWVLYDDPHVRMTRQWQYYLRAINYNMDLKNVYLLLDDHLAFANNTGFKSLDTPGVNDYFYNRLGYDKDPGLDKVRTCSRAVLTGSVQGNMLHVTMFDCRLPPPLKPGRSYPSDIARVNPDDYLFMPRTHPWMFLVANIVNAREEVVQFPRGALYPWTNDNTPYSFMPHIYNPAYGEVYYPLANLQQIPATDPLPRPYRP